ncbi:glycoside hydrolase family 18 protein [Aestuariibaculum marinum]|uniref:Uncharacterized protein n=1 Tax=Aestuariibaculum marinum TaxID=2683592 RepID=A0A8J6PWV0_9FLAO|nr:hypothetical protein [Aestuariibaculum marinum]MBD0824423.1 hypothetical protein [Aestuariibaculum marinum]
MKQYPFYIFSDKTEMEVLYQIFQMKEPDQVKLEKNISRLLLPMGGIAQSGLSYDQFIDKIAKHRVISVPDFETISMKEKFLFKQISKQNIENMSIEEREALNQMLKEEAEKKGFSTAEVASVSSLAGIGAAQLSGFGVYMLASSTVASVASLVGVTLPFAFYTTMSSVISFAIGPVGVLLAAIPLYKTFKDVRSWDDLKDKGNQIYKGLKVFFSGNYEMAEIIFSYFAATRILKLEEYENREKQLLNEVVVANANIAEKQKLYKTEEAKKESIEADIKQVEEQLQDLKNKKSEQVINCEEAKKQVKAEQEVLTVVNKHLNDTIQNKNLLL